MRAGTLADTLVQTAPHYKVCMPFRTHTRTCHPSQDEVAEAPSATAEHPSAVAERPPAGALSPSESWLLRRMAEMEALALRDGTYF